MKLRITLSKEELGQMVSDYIRQYVEMPGGGEFTIEDPPYGGLPPSLTIEVVPISSTVETKEDETNV